VTSTKTVGEMYSGKYIYIYQGGRELQVVSPERLRDTEQEGFDALAGGSSIQTDGDITVIGMQQKRREWNEWNKFFKAHERKIYLECCRVELQYYIYTPVVI
jgi:hypothetical protein